MFVPFLCTTCTTTVFVEQTTSRVLTVRHKRIWAQELVRVATFVISNISLVNLSLAAPYPPQSQKRAPPNGDVLHRLIQYPQLFHQRLSSRTWWWWWL